LDLPRISLFSTPLLSTWVLDDTRRILFDAGDGVTAMLDSRIHRIRLVALTHTHRDHCAGLMQLLNLRGGAGDLVCVYPDGSGSARALTSFLQSFDSRSTAKVRFEPISIGQSIPIEPDRHFLRAFATDHYPAFDPPRTLSVGYHVVRQVDKVKPEFRDLAQSDLDALRLTHGRDHITHTVEDVLLSITGDTMPLDPSVFEGTRILMHECTFLDEDEKAENADRGNPHSQLDEVLDVAVAARVGHLALYHVSRRYEDTRVLAHIRTRCADRVIRFPVSVALPGRQYDDLLAHIVWQGIDTGPSNG
jgi:ribonuclease Z